MPDQLQLRGGTTTEHNSFTGVAREVTVDTTKKTLVVHDGSQAGGTPLMRESGSNGQSTVAIGTAGSNAIEISNGQDIKFIGADNNKHFFFDRSTGNIGVGTINPAERIHSVTVGGANNTFRLDTNQNASRVKAKVVGGENHLVLSSNNDAENLVITGTKVGINTNNPSKTLTVQGDILKTRSDSGLGLIYLQNDGSQNGNIIINQNGGSTRVQLHSDGISYFNGGNVAIGKTTAARPLEVDGGIRLSNDSVVEWGGTDAAIYGSSASNVLFFKTSGSEKMRLNNNGDLIIGATTTPQGRIEVAKASGGSNFDAINLRNHAGDANSAVTLNFIKSTDATNTAARSYIRSTRSGSNSFLDIATSNSPAFRMTTDGKVGLGSNLSSIDATLTVNRDIAQTASLNRSNQTMILKNSGTTSTDSRTSLYFSSFNASNQLSPAAIACLAQGNYKSALAFYTNVNGNGTGHLESNEKIRILSTGGITFNGDTADANALDDYEEGTVTITLGPASSEFTPTSNTSTAYYTKVGRLVTVVGIAQMTTPSNLNSYTNDSTSHALTVSGLPFTILDAIFARSTATLGVGGDIQFPNGVLAAHGNNNSTTFSVFVNKSNGGIRTAPTLAVSTSMNFHFNFSYFV